MRIRDVADSFKIDNAKKVLYIAQSGTILYDETWTTLISTYQVR